MLNKFQVTSIQVALVQAGLHYFDATGVWDNNTTLSYRQYHAVVLLKPDHTLEQPHHIQSVCAELLELSGLTAENNYGADEDELVDEEDATDDDEENDGHDDHVPDDEEDATDDDHIESKDHDQGQGSVIISNGEQAAVVDGADLSQLQEGFQLDQADIDNINGQSGGEQQQEEQQEQQQEQQQEEQQADESESKGEQQEEQAAPAPAPKLTKAEKKAAAKLAAEEAAKAEAERADS